MHRTKEPTTIPRSADSPAGQFALYYSIRLADRQASEASYRVTQLLIRFIVGGAVVSLLAALGDAVKPKSFAGLFAAAPSVAMATLGLAIVADGKLFAAVEARSDDLRRHCPVFVCSRRHSAGDEIQVRCRSGGDPSSHRMDDLRDGRLVRVIAIIANASSFRHFSFKNDKVV